MKKLFLILSTCCCMLLLAAFGMAVMPEQAAVTFRKTTIVSAEAEDAIYSGAYGDHLTWTINPNTGELIIEGTGNIESFSNDSTDQWLNYKKQISKVTIKDGITYIGSYVFQGCEMLETIELPNTLEKIESSAFSGCDNLKYTIENGVKYLGNSSNPYLYLVKTTNSSITTIEIDSGCRIIGSQAFSYCRQLTSVVFEDNSQLITVGYEAFYQCNKLTTVDFGKNCNIKNIEVRAFAYCGFTELLIPSSIEYVGGEAFYQCNNLTYNEYGNGNYLGDETAPYSVFVGIANSALTTLDINLNTKCIITFRNIKVDTIIVPKSVRSIAFYAFNGSSIQNVYFYEESFWNIRFDYMSLPESNCETMHFIDSQGNEVTNIVIPNGVSTIVEGMFYNCKNIQSITIPNSVKNVEYIAFKGCSSLKNVYIKDIRAWLEIDFYYSDGVSENNKYVTPMYYADNLYLNGKLITELVVPEGITKIPSYAFSNCKTLRSVTIPSSVTTIDSNAFIGCTNLIEVINNSSLAIEKGSSSNGSVAYYAQEVRSGTSSYNVVDGYEFVTINGSHYLTGYRGESTNLILPANYNGNNYEIAKNAFSDRTDITSITIPENIRNIDVTAFRNITSLERVTFNAIYCADMTSSPFSESGGEDGFSVEFGAKVAKVPAYLFSNCNVTDITFAENCICAEIGERAFYGCDMLTFAIPDFVTTIGSYAFYNCYNLTSVTVGAAVTSINSYAFQNCYKLVEVINHSSLNIRAGNSSNGYVGYYAVEVHTKESKLINVNDYLFYPNGAYYLVGYVGDDTELSLPADCNGVRNYTIWNYVFYQNDDITSVIIPDYVVSIGNYAFAYCDNLASVIIGDGLASIQSYAFAYCDNLTDVTIGEGYPEVGLSIGYGAFYDCDGLVNVVLPETTSSIGSNAFYSCGKLESIEVGSSVKSIGSSAFNNCSALKSITISENITSIGSGAFSGCSELKIIYVDSPTVATALTSATACGSLINNAEVILINKNVTNVATFVSVVFSYTEEVTVDGKAYTSYSLHTHMWEDCSVDRVQCVQDGFKGSACKSCGLKIGETLPAHNYSKQEHNESHHWDVCSDCGCSINEVLHTWNSGVITTEPTHMTEGVKTFTCVVCGRTDAESVDKIEIHTYNKQVATEGYLVSLATCETKAVYNYSCECGAKGTETFEYGEVLGHTYGAWVSNGNNTHTKTCERDSTHKVTENCSGGTATCTAKAVCKDCEAEYGEKLTHTYNKQVATEGYLVSLATCETKAVYNYSCECGAKGTETFEYGEVLGHSYGAWVSNGNNTHTKTCERDSTHKVTENCGGGEATCTAKAVCKDCNTEYGEKLTHTYNKQVATETYLVSLATCEAKAVYNYSCECGAKGTGTFEYGNALGHKFTNYTFNNDATCTENGTETAECDNAGCIITDTRVAENSALGHTYMDEFKYNESNHWKECACGEKTGEAVHIWDEGTVTKEPTEDQEGERTIACSECGFNRVEAIPKKESSGGCGSSISASSSIIGFGIVSLCWIVMKKKEELIEK